MKPPINRARLKPLCVCMCLWSSQSMADSIGNDTPGPIVIRKVSALKPSDSYERKFRAWHRAVQESDFYRIIVLFKGCAKAGDAYCQLLLAEGVSEWRLRERPGNDPTYGDKFVRYWLRKAFKSPLTVTYVAGNWDRYYLFGKMGYPLDKELSHCWGRVSDSNLHETRRQIRQRASDCEVIEKEKYGTEAHWLRP